MSTVPPVDPQHGPAPALTASVVHGLRWTYASTLLVAIIQIAVTAVLARVLTPSAFGLVAMAGVLLRVGQYFAEMGVGQAVVQRPDLTDRDVHTAFTSAVVLGACFTLIFEMAAPIAEYLFPGTEGVVTVTRVMALTFLIGGLTATTQGLLRREFAFRTIALTEMSTYVVGYALVGLALAWAGFGVWSLVVATLTQSVLTAGVYLVRCRRRLGLALAFESLKSIYSYGGRISLIGFAEVVATTLDTLWAGHFLGASATGLYSRARNLAIVPLYQFTTSLSRVLLPAYSRIQTEVDRLRASYLSGMTVMAAIVIPVAWGVSGAAHELIAVLLGPQWVDAVPLLAVMSLAVPCMLLMHLSALLCDAVAALRARMIITLSRVVWLAALLVVIGRDGLLGIAVAFAVSELLTYLAYQLVMRRLLRAPFLMLWRAQSVGVTAGVVTGVVLYGLHLGLGSAGAPAFVILAAQMLAGGLILLAAVTRVRGGMVWREVRARLTVAGLRLDSGGGARVVRLLDRLSGRGLPARLDTD